MTWLTLPPGTDFPVHNLPFGVFSAGPDAPRVGVAVGGYVLDLAGLRDDPVLGDPVFDEPALNGFLAQGRRRWSAVRARLTALLTDPAHRATVEPHLVPAGDVRLHLPFAVADYVDFYASRQHAEHLGRLFRPDGDPLTPNWRWLPIGYHGRAGTVVVSGTPVTRPSGQRRDPGAATPVAGPTRRLDHEAELGFVVGTPSRLGEPVPVGRFREHVFGVVLVNDWSARDLQAWEYVPLGPFLGKSFATSVSPWVVPLDALDAARVTPPAQVPAPPAYLRGDTRGGLDVTLEVRLNGHLIARPPAAGLYWTPAQMLAHLTANGAALRTGDLFASGTVSGDAPGQEGSLIERTENGAVPLSLPGGPRTFLEDGDTVTITANAPGPDGTRIGFGEVSGTISPAGRLPAG